MFDELLLPIVFLISLTAWTAIRHVARVEEKRRQHEVAMRGEVCHGRVVAIQRPFLLDRCTRLYFEFSLPGSQQMMRSCHVDHRPAEELRTVLPATGTVVMVRYLPEQPHRAIIGKLVANFS